jgi:hypothetical protein
MAYVVMAGYFWKNLRNGKKPPMLKLEELRNSECLNLKNF